jgi:hypothetical protein
MAQPIGSFLGVALVISVTALIVACGSDDSGSSTPTVAVGTAPAIPTAAPTPVVTGNRVTSTAVGYEATIPHGWRLRPNILESETFRGDAYFAPVPSPTPPPETPQTNVAVGCEPLAEPAGELQAEVQTRVEVLNRLGRTELTTTDHAAVDGLPAMQIDYRYVVKSDTAEYAIESREIFFLSEACQWTLTLSASAGQLESNAAALEEFAGSFSEIKDGDQAT